jgi:ABC-2 type transport system ATP-binding protein
MSLVFDKTHFPGFNERLRELCAKTRALKAPSLRVLCATRREHFVKCPSVGDCTPTEGHLMNQMTFVTCGCDSVHLQIKPVGDMIDLSRGWRELKMIIKAKDLVKRYGDLVALDHLSFTVKEGEIFGLLGPNGSGKTTAINCILSLLQYDKGEIEIFDKPMSPDAYHIKRDIGIVMQNVAVYDELTVYGNIDYFCGLYVKDKATRKKLVEEAIDFVGLGEFIKFYPKKLSGGLLRRLNIACGIAHKPKLIILDEPTVAVDPQSRNKILEGIQKLNEQGVTVIYTSHYMEEVEQICTRIMIVDKGRTIATGTKEELKAMITLGEKITVESFGISEKQLEALRKLPGIVTVDYKGNLLVIKSGKGKNNLETVLECIKREGIQFGKIYSELPTLNDVFLEITGKELRD